MKKRWWNLWLGSDPKPYAELSLYEQAALAMDDPVIERYIYSNQKVYAIKQLRKTRGLDLRDAKRVIDHATDIIKASLFVD